MSPQPEFVTFADTAETAIRAIRNGATHLVLDHPLYSARSFLPPSADLGSLALLIETCHKQNPNIPVSINCDRLLHGPDFDQLTPLLDLMRQYHVTQLHVQDIGLLYWLKQHHRECRVIFCPEMGFTNGDALATVISLADAIQLSNELSYTHLKTITTRFPNYPFWIQVQGKILIQYAYRRYLSALDPALADQPMLAQDSDYPGRNYVFLDNAHGHFMYLYFDRCLLPYADLLSDLPLSGWVIDAREESSAYLETALSLYRDIIQGHAIDIRQMEAVAQRPQKAGFFLTNNTDTYRANPLRQTRHMQSVAANLVDFVRDRCVTVEVKRPFYVGLDMVWETPEGKRMAYTVTTMRTLDHLPLETAPAGQLVVLNWTKGITSKSILLYG